MNLPFLPGPPSKFWDVEPGAEVSREFAKRCAYSLATFSDHAQSVIIGKLEGMKPGRRGGAKKLRIETAGYVCWIEVRRDPMSRDQVEIEARSRYIDTEKLKKMQKSG